MLAQQIIQAYQKNRYMLVLDRPFFMNFYAIRGFDIKGFHQNLYNIYDDTCGLIFIDEYNNLQHLMFRFNTDPGEFFFSHLRNPRGVAVLKEGQYRNAYKIDLHQGRVEALCQRLGQVTVYRKKSMLEQNSPFETGWWGINIHVASDEVNEVGQWSAGCMTFFDKEDFVIFMSLLKKHAEKWGNVFSVTLFTEKDFK